MVPASEMPPAASPARWSRRRVLTLGLGISGLAAGAAVGGLELVSHGVLPGQLRLDELDGACRVAHPELVFSTVGPTRSGQFFSRHRNRMVGYTIGYPPRHGPDDRLPLIVMLHGLGGNHRRAVVGMSPAQAVALHVDGRPLDPMAMVTVDGGNGYWNPHPRDDPMGMVIDELIPMVQRMGLGVGPQRIGAMGISMGGYGALLLAERYPHLFSAVAAISPAIWTSYSQAQGANPGAYASAADFAADDAVTHAGNLAGLSIRVASGDADPFHPGVEALVRALPPGADVDFAGGCHTNPFFLAQEPPSLAFLARYLAV